MSIVSGKIAVVTGAASGIGRATARLLTEQGALVVGVDRDEAGLASLCRETGGRFIVADFIDRSQVVRVSQDAIAQHGRVDILINAAGIAGSYTSLAETALGEWDQVMAINCTAPFLLIQTIGQHMVEHGIEGRIVNVTSSSAHRAHTTAAYSVSKAALMQQTRVAAADFGPHRINVNAVAPGLTRTPIIDKAFDAEQLAQALRAGPLANLLQRISEPDDIAGTILFLCSPWSRQITGQTIHVSAGAVV